MITFEQVCKTYNHGKSFAVDHVDLEVKPGELMVILGSSGSGKSTTLKMINRLIEPTSGIITLDHKPIDQYNIYQLRRSIGYVFQKIGLFPHLSIYENLAVVLRLQKMREADIKQRITECLELVNLTHRNFLQRFPDELSGGQQQRVGVARALITKPNVLLMDEPLSALDAINRRALQQEIRDLHKKIQTTIVFVTHDLFEAFRLCDRIAVFHQGKLQQVGTKQEIIQQPASEYVKELINNQQAVIDDFNKVWTAA
ncbi:MAG: ATP-binding cassette domain-containing protein [Coxiellaceae bacterium]|nr:ATP-binding cassette domain-containing protein [Coxiellaceae bacterium]